MILLTVTPSLSILWKNQAQKKHLKCPFLYISSWVYRKDIHLLEAEAVLGKAMKRLEHGNNQQEIAAQEMNCNGGEKSWH